MANARQSTRSRCPKAPFAALPWLPVTLGALCAFELLAGCTGGGGSSGGDSSGGGGGSSGDSCYDYTSFTATTATFSKDVLPTLRTSCGLSASCHNSQTLTGTAQHYFGPSITSTEPTPAQIDEIFKQSVGAPAFEEPDMKVIDPGHPETSFLMYKLDGVECGKLKCAATKTCKESMPIGSKLAADKRDVIRSWIAKGAMKD